MSSAQRVLSTLNFFTGEGVNHYPDGCDRSAIEALVSDYLNKGHSNDKTTTGMKIKQIPETIQRCVQNLL